MIIEIIVMGAIGLFFGLILAYLSHRFKVKVNPKVEQVRALLPGANCGACGLAGCDAFAEAVVAGKIPTDGCIPGQKDVAEKIAAVLGNGEPQKSPSENIQKSEPTKIERKVPEVNIDKCVGCKLCEKACHFEAIKVIEKKAVVDSSKCKKCMACVKACRLKALS